MRKFLNISLKINIVLSNGIVFNGVKYSVEINHFSLDSKAASYFLGLKSSFTHEYCCRFCLTQRSKFSETLFETNIRTHESFLLNFENHLTSEDSDVFGINKLSLLRHLKIEKFTELVPPCIYHDIFEGVGKVVIDLTIKYLCKKKYINGDTFASELSSFEFLELDKHKIPNFPRGAQSLRLTASESYNLLRFFSFFVSKFAPLNDEIFQLLSCFNIFVNICMVFDVNDCIITLLNTAVADLIYFMQKIFPEYNFTIKFHHFIDYGSIMKKFGSLRKLSTIHFEQQHSFLKKLMHSNKNWIYPELSVAKKYVRARISDVNIPPGSHKNPIIYNNKNILLDKYMSESVETIFKVSQCTFFSITYKPGYIVALSSKIALQISEIFLIESKYILIGWMYDAENEEVTNRCILSKTLKTIAISINELKKKSPMNLYKIEGEICIFPHHFIENE